MLPTLVIVFHVAGVISAIDAVSATRTSQGAIAWAVSLVSFPYLAVPAYWVLGRSKFRGYVTARQAGDARIRHFAVKAGGQVAQYRLNQNEKSPAVLAAERLVKIPVLGGNDAELLVDGKATFASIFEGIESAQDYVIVQFFIIKDDGLGRELKSRLIAKARQDVRVYLLFDEIGSKDLPAAYVSELRAAGAEAYEFGTRRGRGNRFQLNFRNHRKTVVVDGHVAWIGGHNVGDEYLGKGPLGHWRDTHVRIEGPAALAAQLAFIEDWHWATATVPELSWVPKPSSADIHALIAPTGPADELETAALMFVHAINSAIERIWIASPYFVPDEAVMAALLLAGLRGVDVRILIPDAPDHLLVYLAAFDYFDEASSTGVRFFRYTNGFPHQKVVLIDGRTAAIGTANFDNRSFRLNFEITAVLIDEGFAAQVETMLLEDFANAREMTPNDTSDKSFLFMLGVRLARLTAPIQ